MVGLTNATTQLTQSHLCFPLLLCEVVPLVDPASPGHLTCGELLVVRQHPVVVLHEDGLPLRQLGLGLVLPALLLHPVEEHSLLVSQANSHQGARQQMQPDE